MQRWATLASAVMMTLYAGNTAAASTPDESSDKANFSSITQLEIQAKCAESCAASDSSECHAQCFSQHTVCMNSCADQGVYEDTCAGHCVRGEALPVNSRAGRGASGAALGGAAATNIATQTTRATDGSVGNRPLAIGVNLRGYIHNVPSFALRTFLREFQPHWDDNLRFIGGGEIVFRKNDRTDYIIGFDWADYRTRDGWWLDKGEPLASANWVENSMRTLTLSLEWNGIANLDKKKRTQIYGGVGLGAAFRLGDFTKYDVPEGCFARTADISFIHTMTPSTMCPELPGSDVLLDGSPAGEANSAHNEKIPRVLPSLILSLGFRYIIADVVSIGIEGGLKTAGFYGGLEVGFIVGKREPASAR